jgi:ribosomal protein S18 acetylase RimI-like enzyme
MIRPAIESEAEEVARIINSAFEIEREFRSGERTSAAEVRELMRREVVLVAEQEGRLAGVVDVRVDGTTGYFGMLAVDASARRAGVGRALVEAAEEFCRRAGCTVMTLSTGEERHELFPYYRGMGYRVVDVRTSSSAAFKRPIHVVSMAKRLAPG